MPYITQERRDALATGAGMQTAGELNYRLTMTLLADLEFVYVRSVMLFSLWMNEKGISYESFNTIAGAVTLAQIEHTRRMGDKPNTKALAEMQRAFGDFNGKIVFPYEDRKLVANGDVFPLPQVVTGGTP